ncbi:MAG: T9SS type A sorting domain-containing protein [Flavobacteriales bacterium]
MKRRTLALILFAMACVPMIHAQFHLRETEVLPPGTATYACILTADDNMIVVHRAGSQEPVQLSKYSDVGELLWRKQITQEGASAPLAFPNGVVADASGGCYITLFKSQEILWSPEDWVEDTLRQHLAIVHINSGGSLTEEISFTREELFLSSSSIATGLVEMVPFIGPGSTMGLRIITSNATSFPSEELVLFNDLFEPQWIKSIGDPLFGPEIPTVTNYDLFDTRRVLTTTDGNILRFTGSLFTENSFEIVEIDVNGNLVSANRYHYINSAISQFYRDLTVAADGSIHVLADLILANGLNGTLIIRIRPDGSVIDADLYQLLYNAHRIWFTDAGTRMVAGYGNVQFMACDTLGSDALVQLGVSHVLGENTVRSSMSALDPSADIVVGAGQYSETHNITSFTNRYWNIHRFAMDDLDFCFTTASTATHYDIPADVIEELPVDDHVSIDLSGRYTWDGPSTLTLEDVPAVEMVDICGPITGIHPQPGFSGTELLINSVMGRGEPAKVTELASTLVLTVQDMSGRVALSNSTTGLRTIPTTMLVPGAYVLQGRTKDGTFIGAQRFIVE